MKKIKNCPKCRTVDFKSCHSMYCPVRKNKHGGARKGSGAKPKPEHLKKEKTKVMRIPMSLISHVVGLIKKV